MVPGCTDSALRSLRRTDEDNALPWNDPFSPLSVPACLAPVFFCRVKIFDKRLAGRFPNNHSDPHVVEIVRLYYAAYNMQDFGRESGELKSRRDKKTGRIEIPEAEGRG